MIQLIPEWGGVLIFICAVGALMIDAVKRLFKEPIVGKNERGVKLDLPIIKELDPDIMVAVALKYEKTKIITCGIIDKRRDKCKTTQSRSQKVIEQFIKDEYEKAQQAT